MTDELPSMYGEFASWFHLLTAPEDYAEEAAYYFRVMTETLGDEPRTLLELGSGGGNNAMHYKRWVTATLTDSSPGMLAMSRAINPECEHLEGDMRTLRLGRTFDAVFVHDAVDYMTTEDDLRRAIETAAAHCRPGGVAVFVPDALRESFAPGTDHGGHDGEGRSMRYLEWSWDPDPNDTTYVTDYAYLLREDGKPPRAAHDQHVLGLFALDDWLRLLTAAGFRAEARPVEIEDAPPGYTMFVGVREG
jgi:SAM-dependent methyltransferase